MSNIITQTTSAIESALIMGDLSKLTTNERLSYYKSVCESVGLNPLTKPFDYIQLNGKLTLYAKRDATDQLRKVHGVSIKITAREKIDDIYIVTAQGTDKTGRVDESTGAVFIAGLKGEALANAFLKAETKAKRRVTLSLCGLGLLDETEVQTIPDAKTFSEPTQAEKNVEQIEAVLQETGFNNQPNMGKKKNPIFEKPAPEKPHPGDYIFKFGKHKGKSFNEFQNVDELEQYVLWIPKGLESVNAKTGKKPEGVLRENMAEALEAGEAYFEYLGSPGEEDQNPKFEDSESEMKF